jgi:hypothetical protein
MEDLLNLYNDLTDDERKRVLTAAEDQGVAEDDLLEDESLLRDLLREKVGIEVDDSETEDDDSYIDKQMDYDDEETSPSKDVGEASTDEGKSSKATSNTSKNNKAVSTNAASKRLADVKRKPTVEQDYIDKQVNPDDDAALDSITDKILKRIGAHSGRPSTS